MGKLVEIAMLTQWEVGRREDKESMAGNTAIPKLPAPQPCLQEWDPPVAGLGQATFLWGGTGTPPEKHHTTDLICSHKPFSST